LEHAIRNGATQVVIMGAGFDTRAHRFAELLQGTPVIEIDYGATQLYKKQRVEAALGGAPANVVYASIDFARESLGEVLRRAGFQSGRKTYYICEGVSMYVPEEGMKETLRAIAAESAPGSALLLEYLNRGGLEVLTKYPMGMVKNAISWGEPFVFGVPDGNDREFFLETGLELGETLKVGSPESIRRYVVRQDGELLWRPSGEGISAAAGGRATGHGRSRSPASRDGRRDVGLLASRVNRHLADEIHRVLSQGP